MKRKVSLIDGLTRKGGTNTEVADSSLMLSDGMRHRITNGLTRYSCPPGASLRTLRVPLLVANYPLTESGTPVILLSGFCSSIR